MLGLVLAAVLAWQGGTGADGAVKTTPAEAFADFQTACERDGGALWGVSLCGPLLLIDHQAGIMYANAPDAGGLLTEGEDGVWRGDPANGATSLRANFAAEWSGVRWAIVQHDPSRSADDYLVLTLHESFHRIQPDLPFDSQTGMGIAGHLDAETNRVSLRLQFRALQAALQTNDENLAPSLIADAAAFAAHRLELDPAAREAEAALERHEGLAEYTAWKIAFEDDAGARFSGGRLEGEDGASSYARSFPYLTGPGIGLALDRMGVPWRAALLEGDARGLSDMMLDEIGESRPADGPHFGVHRDYGIAEIAAEEAERARFAAERLADATARFVEGPTLRVPLGNITFDPNSAFDLPPHGQVYGSITVEGDWGRIESKTGLLLAWDIGRTVAPASGDPALGASETSDWIMEVSPGWGWIREGEAWVLVED